MNNLIETRRKGNEILRIFRDFEGVNPRDWDNLGTIATKHPRYNIGEEQIHEPIEWLEEKLEVEEKGEYSNERLAELEEKFFEKYIALPVYIYEHSGIVLSVTPFSSYFDSGKLGYIYTTKEDVKEEGLTEEKALKILENEIETLNEIATEGCFGFEVVEQIPVKTKKTYPDGTIKKFEEFEEEHKYSCWGYIGFKGIEQIREETGFNTGNEEVTEVN